MEVVERQIGAVAVTVAGLVVLISAGTRVERNVVRDERPARHGFGAPSRAAG